MPGPTNAVIGDVVENFVTDIPETKPPEQDLTNEKNMAKFSRTKEFARLKEHLEARIKFFQTQLPDGRPLTADVVEPLDWLVANLVIGEFKAIIDIYERAAEVVENVF